MKKASTRGKKSTVTIRKIQSLGVEVNPAYLNWSEKNQHILIRPRRKTGEKIATTIHAQTVGGDLKALFYAAAGIRNFFIRNGELPNKDQRKRIINRALITEKNKETWYKPGQQSRGKSFSRKEQLQEDHTEVSIDIKSIGEKIDLPVDLAKRFIYKGGEYYLVKIPAQNIKSFGFKRYNGQKEAFEAAKKYRDEVIKNNPELLKKIESKYIYKIKDGYNVRVPNEKRSFFSKKSFPDAYAAAKEYRDELLVKRASSATPTKAKRREPQPERREPILERGGFKTFLDKILSSFR
jgi:hypothetical protein